MSTPPQSISTMARGGPSSLAVMGGHHDQVFPIVSRYRDLRLPLSDYELAQVAAVPVTIPDLAPAASSGKECCRRV